MTAELVRVFFSVCILQFALSMIVGIFSWGIVL